MHTGPHLNARLQRRQSDAFRKGLQFVNNQLDPEPQTYRTVEILETRIHVLPVEELVDYIGQTISRDEKSIVANVNVHAMNIAYEMAEFRRFLNDSEIVFCDGFGVKLGAKFIGKDIPYRYTPPDWIPLLANLCVQQGYSLFLLGAKPGVAERAMQVLERDHPGIRVVGTYHGYFDKTPGSADTRAVVEKISAARPNILILGFGMPLQEMWLRDNWPDVDSNIAITAGALLDYLAGEVYRAPRAFTDNGLEWLARLLIEPRRLWKRYLIGNPKFLWRIIKHRMGYRHPV